MVPRIPSTSSRGRWAAVMLLTCLFAAGCGGNHGSSTGSSTSASGAPTTGATGAKTFGTLPSPCGAGTAKGATAKWGDRHVDRYSLAKFLRCWLLRQIYEQRSAIDEAIVGQRDTTL